MGLDKIIWWYDSRATKKIRDVLVIGKEEDLL